MIQCIPRSLVAVQPRFGVVGDKIVHHIFDEPFRFLANRTNVHNKKMVIVIIMPSVRRLSVRLSVMKCILAKQYIKCVGTSE